MKTQLLSKQFNLRFPREVLLMIGVLMLGLINVRAQEIINAQNNSDSSIYIDKSAFIYLGKDTYIYKAPATKNEVANDTEAIKIKVTKKALEKKIQKSELQKKLERRKIVIQFRIQPGSQDLLKPSTRITTVASLVQGHTIIKGILNYNEFFLNKNNFFESNHASTHIKTIHYTNCSGGTSFVRPPPII